MYYQLLWRSSSVGQSSGIIIRLSGVQIPPPLPKTFGKTSRKKSGKMFREISRETSGKMFRETSREILREISRETSGKIPREISGENFRKNL